MLQNTEIRQLWSLISNSTIHTDSSKFVPIELRVHGDQSAAIDRKSRVGNDSIYVYCKAICTIFLTVLTRAKRPRHIWYSYDIAVSIAQLRAQPRVLEHRNSFTDHRQHGCLMIIIYGFLSRDIRRSSLVSPHSVPLPTGHGSVESENGVVVGHFGFSRPNVVMIKKNVHSTRYYNIIFGRNIIVIIYSI